MSFYVTGNAADAVGKSGENGSNLDESSIPLTLLSALMICLVL